MEIIGGARLPVYSWATDLEGEALRQARNLGDLEVAVHQAALMADAHAGFERHRRHLLLVPRARNQEARIERMVGTAESCYRGKRRCGMGAPVSAPV